MIADQLKRLRKERGWTQKETARKLQISPSAIGMYEQGRREPELSVLIEICRLFEVEIDEIVNGVITKSEQISLEHLLQQIKQDLGRYTITHADEELTDMELERIYDAMKLGAYLVLAERNKNLPENNGTVFRP